MHFVCLVVNESEYTISYDSILPEKSDNRGIYVSLTGDL